MGYLHSSTNSIVCCSLPRYAGSHASTPESQIGNMEEPDISQETFRLKKYKGRIYGQLHN
jgi:hypothetical protein